MLLILTHGYGAEKCHGGIPCGRPGGVIFCGGVAASFLLLPSVAVAQQALRDSLAGDAIAQADRIHPDSLPYTFKQGDFRLLVTPSLAINWNDNINATQSNTEQDWLVNPTLQINASYPISERNLLNVNLGIIYSRYLIHPELSSLQIQSGSAVSFDMYIKDFLINFHDLVDYTKDPALQPELAGMGSADLATLNNTAGLTATWDLQDVTLTAGYDHGNVISSAQQFDSENHSTESFIGRAGLKLNPSLTSGVEASAAFTRYDQMILNNNEVYSLGIYGVWQSGSYLQVQPRVGYTLSDFAHTSSSVQTSGQGSYYANLTISHQVTGNISYNVDLGHQMQLGIQSDAVETSYVRCSLPVNVFKNVGLNSSFSYEHGIQGVGNVSGNLQEIYDSYSASLNASYSITKKIDLGLNYRLTYRSSNEADRSYVQNVVGLQITYHQ